MLPENLYVKRKAASKPTKMLYAYTPTGSTVMPSAVKELLMTVQEYAASRSRLNGNYEFQIVNGKADKLHDGQNDIVHSMLLAAGAVVNGTRNWTGIVRVVVKDGVALTCTTQREWEHLRL
jgi:hypothetical protein